MLRLSVLNYKSTNGYSCSIAHNCLKCNKKNIQEMFVGFSPTNSTLCWHCFVELPEVFVLINNKDSRLSFHLEKEETSVPWK
jgi:hypothetical protein